MSWLIGLLLKGIGLGRGLWRWLTADFSRLAIALALCWSVALLIAFNVVRNQRDAARAGLAAERAAHAQTIVNYRVAADAAKRRQDANLARVAAARAADNERIAHDYSAALADARARAGRLRAELAARADPGRPGAPRMPASLGAAAGAPQAAGAQGLSDACLMTVDERLVATEQALQLDALIEAVEAQMRIPTSSGAVQ